MDCKYVFIVDRHPESAIALLHNLSLSSPEHFLATTPTGANILELPQIQSENLVVITGLHATWEETCVFAQMIRDANSQARVVLRSTTVQSGDYFGPVFDAVLNKSDEEGFLDELSLVLTR